MKKGVRNLWRAPIYAAVHVLSDISGIHQRKMKWVPLGHLVCNKGIEPLRQKFYAMGGALAFEGSGNPYEAWEYCHWHNEAKLHFDPVCGPLSLSHMFLKKCFQTRGLVLTYPWNCHTCGVESLRGNSFGCKNRSRLCWCPKLSWKCCESRLSGGKKTNKTPKTKKAPKLN